MVLRHEVFQLKWFIHLTQEEEWYHVGPIIKPHFDQSIGNSKSNVTGVPVLVIDNHYYVYFVDTRDKSPNNDALDQRVAVAKSSKSALDILKEFQSSEYVSVSVPLFEKYHGGHFSTSGIGGDFQSIISYNSQPWSFDVHSDAAYNTAIKKYMLVLNMPREPIGPLGSKSRQLYCLIRGWR